jgi:hypothetical protein
MPRTGTPSSSNAASTVGTSASYTDDGPPDRMMPRGAHSRIQSTETVGGWISQYTRSSRTRRAMSCVNCEP